ncbi:MAG: M20/M25/M40 family metallo-hydrolase [Promethearchaeota archaeon]
MDYVELLRKIIAFETVNDRIKDQHPTRDCPDYLRDILAASNITTEIIEQNGYYAVLGFLGKGRPITCFIAHYDVVPVGSGWNSNPFELTIRDGKGYGRGAADDKGNVVALLLTAETLASQALPGTVVFAMTGDEELGGNNGAAAVRQRLEQLDSYPNYLVTADGLGMQLITRRRNTCGFTITVPKKPKPIQGAPVRHRFTTEFLGRETRHSAYFQPGVDIHALLAASSFLRFHPHLQVVEVDGGFLKSNVVPDWVELLCFNPLEENSTLEEHVYDENLTRLLRVLLPLSRVHFPAYPSDYGITLCPNLLLQREDVWEVYFDGRAMTTDTAAEEAAINAVLKEQLIGIDYTLTVHMGKAYMNTPSTTRIVTTAQEIANQLGLDRSLIEMGGASDNRHFTDRPIEAIDFGPVGNNIHGPNEYVVLDSIPKVASFYTRLVKSLHGQSSR